MFTSQVGPFAGVVPPFMAIPPAAVPDVAGSAFAIAPQPMSRWTSALSPIARAGAAAGALANAGWGQGSVNLEFIVRVVLEGGVALGGILFACRVVERLRRSSSQNLPSIEGPSKGAHSIPSIEGPPKGSASSVRVLPADVKGKNS